MTLPEQLEAIRQAPSTVECSGCTACCVNDTIYLGREDRDLSKPSSGSRPWFGSKDGTLEYEWHAEVCDGGHRPVLNRKLNGECVYLTASGCSIHGRAPDICRRFDCRVLFLLTPQSDRILKSAKNASMIEVYAAALTRLETLKVDQ